MKKFKIALLSFSGVLLLIATVGYLMLTPAFAQKLKLYKGSCKVTWTQPKQDPGKKNIFIIADNDGTEMFDLMAPFYLFNATEKANVYVLSEKKAPVLLVNTLFIMPHYTFSEMDSLKIKPDVIVIPNLTVHLSDDPKPVNVNWIKSQVTSSTMVLSICDGSATAAATGLFDGKPLTTHASDFNKLKKKFPKPSWVKNLSVTESGNLYSTAGVSNAVEGSLMVIERLFGDETMQHLIKNIRYPHDTVPVAHKSEVVGTGTVIRIISKVLFQKNEKVAVWLSDNMNEFELGAFLDTHSRTFPSSFNTFSHNNEKVISKYGLILYPTGIVGSDPASELHVLDPSAIKQVDQSAFPNASFIVYNSLAEKYPIDFYLERIGAQYGNRYQKCVSVTLDYNQ